MNKSGKQGSFWWQLCNSFMPWNYGDYDYLDQGDTKRFLKTFAILTYAVIAAMYLLAIHRSGAAINNGKLISEEDGYKYSIKNGVLKVDEPVFVDDLNSGVYVNITDKVESFGNTDMYEFFEKGYKKVLLISRTDRVKMTADSQTYHYVVNYFDDMENTSEAGRNNTVPAIGAGTIVLLAIGAVVFYFAYPAIVRLYALIIALIAKLFCALFRLDTDKERLKIFAVYAYVPSQILTLLSGIAATFFARMTSGNFLENVSANPIYSIVNTIAVFLPFILVMIAAFAERRNER